MKKMAIFIGSDLQTGNWGEDFLIEKLMEYLDDTYVIYRNRPIFGAQFDVALFAPRVGIIIFEPKSLKTCTQFLRGQRIISCIPEPLSSLGILANPIVS